MSIHTGDKPFSISFVSRNNEILIEIKKWEGFAKAPNGFKQIKPDLRRVKTDLNLCAHSKQPKEFAHLRELTKLFRFQDSEKER